MQIEPAPGGPLYFLQKTLPTEFVELTKRETMAKIQAKNP
jgi:hypothetical protein